MEKNKIYLGDAYKLIKEIPDNSVDLIIIDPPYEIENTNGGKKSNFAKSIQNVNQELEKKRETLLNGIDKKILKEFIRIQDKINIYIWCNHKQVIKYLDFFVTKHKCKFDMLFWKKTNAPPTFHNKYLTDKEYILYFRKGGYCNPKCYEDASTVFMQPINILDKNKYTHPTIKPLNIIKTLINNSSKKGDLVLDCFCGSGTTCVAAKELGRHFIGMEIDPEYHKIAVDRLNGITANGQTSIFTDFNGMGEKNWRENG